MRTIIYYVRVVPCRSELCSFEGSCRTVHGDGQSVRWIDFVEDKGI